MMRLERTSTGVIIHSPTNEVKEKVLEYFSLEDPIREYFIYSGNDPDNKPRFGKEKDVIYIPSGFLEIDDPVIKKLKNHAHKIETVTPKPCTIVMNREPRSPLQEDCISVLTKESKSSKICVMVRPGTGKAEPYSRKIPSLGNNGYTLMGDLKVGDFVFDRTGKLTEITEIFEQGEQDIYHIEFEDGREAYCHGEHLWTVCVDDSNEWVTKTTNELMVEKHSYYIPICEPVQYPPKQLRLHPYVLGAFIGQIDNDDIIDSDVLYIRSGNDYLVETVCEKCDAYWERDSKEGLYQAYFLYKENGDPIEPKEFFKGIPSLNIIPNEYLVNDPESRFAIINGLLESACYCSQDGYLILKHNKELLDQVEWILYSLGINQFIREDDKLIKILRNAIYPKLNRKDKLRIVYIEPDHRENCRCIMVNNPEHLYLTEDFIVTHNTFIAMYSSSKLALKPLIVAPTTLLKNQWIDELESCGIDHSDIATNIFEGTNKKCCVVTISAIENALRDDWNGLLHALNDGEYGIKIIDEAHLHLKGVLKLDSISNIKNNWYLSATLGRSSDDEDTILNYALLDSERFVGDKKYVEYQKEYITIYQQDIYYQPSAKLCSETFKYGKKGLIKASYYQMLLQYKEGVPFINNMVYMVKKARAITKSDKKLLLLVPLLEVIERVKLAMKADPYFNGLNIVSVDGKMPMSQKQANLSDGNIILSTVQSCGTGVDIKDLVAVVNFDQMASPIILEQMVGRLRDRGYETIYIDICDQVKYAKTVSNWGKRRRTLFPYFPGTHQVQKKLPNIYS